MWSIFLCKLSKTHWLLATLLVIGLTNCSPSQFYTNQDKVIPTRAITLPIEPIATNWSSQGTTFVEPTQPTSLETEPSLAPLGEIKICVMDEPETLYIMNSQKYVERLILTGIYDQSINDTAHPSVILDKLPNLENGQVTTQTTLIRAGDMIFSPTNSARINYEGPEIMINQTVITFTLKPDMRWSDGWFITAEDSKYAFTIMANSNTPTEKSLIELTASYEVINNQQIRWTGIPNYFPHDYLKHFIHPLPEHAWQHLSPQELLTSPLSTQSPLGWGAFRVIEWQKGISLTLERNPFYEPQPRSQKIIFRFDVDYTVATIPALSVERSYIMACDLTILHSRTTPTVLNEYLQSLNYYVYPLTWIRADFIMQNLDGSPTIATEQAIRQAINYALFATPVPPNNSWKPTISLPNHQLFNPIAGMSFQYPFRPQLGRDILSELGWIDENNDGFLEKDGQSLTIRVGSATSFGGIASILGLVGIRVEEIPLTIEQISYPSEYRNILLENGVTGLDLLVHESPIETLYECPEFMSAFNEESVEMDESNGMLYLSHVTSLTNYSNATYDLTCQQALQTLGETNKTNLLIQAQTIFANDVPVIPLAIGYTVAFARLGFAGFQPDNENIESWNIAEWYYDANNVLP